MRRHQVEPRPSWQKIVESQGLVFHTHRGESYWNESACYEFTEAEIHLLESATNELHGMCIAAVEHVVDKDRWYDYRIPEDAIEMVRISWNEQPPSLYGRFDLAYNGTGHPKLLEYNADTPTSLLEAATIQWHWLQDVFPSYDQFNSLWEGLVETWTKLEAKGALKGSQIHFASSDEWEDVMTTTLMQDAAEAAGQATQFLDVREIGWDSARCQFVDLKDRPIFTLFKLYPWEWILADDFGKHICQTPLRTQFIEPAWKMLLSNKALLAVLWDLFPGHPNLLPAFLDEPRELQEYVRKPRLSREGANITIHRSGGEVSSPGIYGAEGYVYQAIADLGTFDGRHPVLGCWVIGDDARGMGIRESLNPITDDLAQFVPHYFH